MTTLPHTGLFLRLFLSSFSPFTPSFFSCVPTVLRCCEQKAADVTHYFRQRTCRTENRGGRRDGQFGCHRFSSPTLSEQMGMRTSGYGSPTLFSGQPASQPVCFLLWASFISLLHKAETWFSSFPPIFFAKLVSELAPNSTFNLIYSQINSLFLTWDTHMSRTATNFSSRDWAAEFLIDILKTHGNCSCWKPTNYNLVSNLKFCQTPIGVFTCI